MLRLNLIRARRVPEKHVLHLVYRVVDSHYFNNFINCLIVCSIILMCLHYYQLPPHYKDILDEINKVITIIYTLEAFLKIVALRWDYFTDSWNKLDFATVLALNSSYIMDMIDMSTSGSKLA